MKDQSIQTKAMDRRSTVGRILLEAMLVAVVGAVFAFAANRISPRGLSLARNYFPTGTNDAMRTSAGANPPEAAAGTNSTALSSPPPLAGQMRPKELQLLDGHQAVQLFHDSHLKSGTIAFIDARDEEHYQAGHIPGAYEFDPYHPEKYFPAVLPVCRAAEQIVVYCHGGDCDDSQTAALLLRDVGIPNRKALHLCGRNYGMDQQPPAAGDRRPKQRKLTDRNSMNNRPHLRNIALMNLFTVLARWLLGATFLYLGLTKALHPVEFLKLMRQYDLTQDAWLLNVIAVSLPWFEVFCGLLLLAGVAVRGTALTLTVMLVPFTLLVLHRALLLQAAWHIPFCAVKFDCGCGTGEEFICRKLSENFLLIALSAWLLAGRGRQFCVRYSLTGR